MLSALAGEGRGGGGEGRGGKGRGGEGRGFKTNQDSTPLIRTCIPRYVIHSFIHSFLLYVINTVLI